MRRHPSPASAKHCTVRGSDIGLGRGSSESLYNAGVIRLLLGQPHLGTRTGGLQVWAGNLKLKY
jgi:hypothetical protein